MRKILLYVVICITVLIIVACSNETDSPKILSKEGIAPYELTESEKYVLQSFGMEQASQMISFHAPKETVSLNVNVYRLLNDKSWSKINWGATALRTNRESNEQLTGTFTMQLKDDYALDLNINMEGRSTYKTNPITLHTDMMASVKTFLEEFQEIEMNKEIPIAVMVYSSGSQMRSYALEDYFTPTKFKGMDLVQAVTLTFSDKEF